MSERYVVRCKVCGDVHDVRYSCTSKPSALKWTEIEPAQHVEDLIMHPGMLLKTTDGRVLLVGDVNLRGGVGDDSREDALIVAAALPEA